MMTLRFVFKNKHLLVFLLIAQSATTQAQTVLKDTLNINQVTVSVQKERREVTPVQILTSKELKKLSSNSVADAVRYFSGVQVKDYGGIGGLKTINIRSMGSNHVGVFYDGVELGNAQNGIVDLGRFSLDNMETLSIYNGQRNALLQTAKDYASSSSLYMATRKPVFSDKKTYNMQFGLKGGSFETINPSFLLEKKLSENVSLSFSTEYLYTSGKYKFSYSKKDGYDTTEVRKNGDVRMLRGEVSLFGKLEEGEWKAKVYYYNSERGYPGASVREEPGKFIHQDRQWDDNLFAQGSYRQRFSNLYSLLVNGKYAYDVLHYMSDPNLDVTTMYVDNRYKQREAYLSAAHLFAVKPWLSFSLANDLQRNVLDADLVNFVYPRRLTVLSSASVSIYFDKFKFQGNCLNTYVNDKTEIPDANAGDKSIFTYSFVASYAPLKKEDLNFRAFCKRIFRMPTLNELYYTFVGNINLNPEYTNQYDFGITYSKKFPNGWFTHLELQADGYFNQVEDKIVAIPTSNQFRWTMLNLGYVEIRGIDFAAAGHFKILGADFDARLSYTYQKAQDFTDSSSEWYGGQIPYAPWHSGSFVAGAQYKEWFLNYSFIYTGERYESVANTEANYVPAWYTHDVSLGKLFHFKKFDFKASAEVNNILNQQYEIVSCYPMPGTNFKLKLHFIL